MITSIKNNIGIAQVSFKDYQTENFTVLNGKFDVDPTTAAWKAASEIVFEFPELAMNKSGISAVYFIDTRPFEQYDKVHRGTILKSWISNNRLHIEKIDAFDDYGPLHFYVCNAYAKGGQRCQIVKDGYVTTGIENQPSGTRVDKSCLMVKDHYIFCQIMFREFETEDGTLEQSFDIIGMPDDVDVYIPVVYANFYINKKGAPMTEGHLQGGHFSCTNTETMGYTANDGTFFQFFAVRDGINHNPTE